MAVNRDHQVHVRIQDSADIVAARQQGRALAAIAGFSHSNLTVIADVFTVMRDGYSTGLPGARRLTDEFAIVSVIGTGTVVTMKKWVA